MFRRGAVVGLLGVSALWLDGCGSTGSEPAGSGAVPAEAGGMPGTGGIAAGASAGTGVNVGGAAAGGVSAGGTSGATASLGGAGDGGQGEGGAAGSDEDGPVEAVSVGYWHACALVRGGARCWGTNSVGQLGDGSQEDSDVAVDVEGLTSGVTSISAGYYHTCALANGTVWCWGLNQHGQLGNDSLEDSAAPVQVEVLGSNVTAISAGANHTCALVDGAAYCWGSNELGQVGDDSTDDRLVPVAVAESSTGVTALEAGEYQTCAIRDGAVVCWGQNQAGYWDLVPAEVEGANGAMAVTTGGNHACALLEVDGAAGSSGSGGASGTDGSRPVCWGHNSYGQLGNGETEKSPTPVDVRDPALSEGVLASSIDQISAGSAFTCAVVLGAAYCWGDNLWAQVGDGTLIDRLVPTPVAGLSSGVTAVSAGGEARSCAIVRGHVYCWGLGSWGTDNVVPELVVLEP